MIAETACVPLLLAGLAVIAATDIRSYRIPDAVTLPLIGLGILCALPQGAVWEAATGAVLGYVFMVAVELAYRRLRGQDGLGRGDAKLFAVAGAWAGPGALPLVLLLAASGGLVAALLLGRRTAPVPFGPFLGFGLLAVIAGQYLSIL